MPLNNSQYDSLMRDYQQQQLKNERERRTRCQAIYQQIPRIQEIDNEIASLSAGQARKLIMGDTQALTTLRNLMSQLKQEKETLLKKNHYEADAMRLHYRCPDCQDTGYIDHKPCHCFRQAAINLLYNQSNIKEILGRENFSTLNMEYYSRDVLVRQNCSQYDYMTQVVSYCKNYTAPFPNGGKNIYFSGTTGTGKTFLSNCIAAAIMQACHSVIYLSATQLFDLFEQEAFSHEEAAGTQLENYISDCDLLIIDDLGTELVNSFTASRLFYCINQRLILKKSTIISSNLNLNQIRDNYSERIASRIMSYYDIILLFGHDIRTTQRRKNQR